MSKFWDDERFERQFLNVSYKNDKLKALQEKARAKGLKSDEVFDFICLDRRELLEENRDLKRKLDLAVEALEYYAETENWHETGYEDSRSKTEGDGGKHARKLLKEIKGEQ